MRNLQNGHSWPWTRNQFLDRKYRMQEMYQNFMEGEEWNLPPVSHVTGSSLSCDYHVRLFYVRYDWLSPWKQKQDPFWEPTDMDVQIGSVHVYLQSLSYMVRGIAWNIIQLHNSLIYVLRLNWKSNWPSPITVVMSRGTSKWKFSPATLMAPPLGRLMTRLLRNRRNWWAL